MHVTTRTSLYDSSRTIEVDYADESASVCVAELAALDPLSTRRILLIHGNPSSLDHWRLLAPALRQRASLVAYDQPGLGRSPDFRDGQQSLERSADLALAVLDRIGWSEPIDVMGQSHGGMVAVALAARAPQRVRSLMLLGTGGVPAHPMYRFFMTPKLDRVLFVLDMVHLTHPERVHPVLAAFMTDNA